MSTISIIVATSENFVIGKDNNIPWKLPTDMKYFKTTTQNSVVLMGRKCWESIPSKNRPLPNRTNIVVSRNQEFKADGAILYNDLEKVLSEYKSLNSDKEIFVIGGSDIYEAAFPFADKLYLTRVLAEVEGNVVLRGFNPNDWVLAASSEVLEENGYKYRFEVYNKKRQ